MSRIKLTETQLHNIIRRCVNEVIINNTQLNEISAGLAYDAYNISNERGDNDIRTQQFRNYYDDKLQKFKNDTKFLNWFSGSVVVDEDGKPKECYHGDIKGYDYLPFGSWFSENESYALTYIKAPFDTKDEYLKGGMYVSFLNIKNPFELGQISIEMENTKKWFKTPQIQDYIQRLGIKDVASFIKEVENDDLFDCDFIWGVTTTEVFQWYVQQAGYDGMHSWEDDASCWCIFDESQVCSLSFEDRNQRPY